MKYLLISILLICCKIVFAQSGVSVNAGAVVADPSAELEIKSTTKGVLIPSLANTAAVTSPATGLIIFNQSCKCFSYHVGGGTWIDFPSQKIATLRDKDNDTKIYAEKSADEDKLRFASGMTTNTETEVAILDQLGLDLSFRSAAYKFNHVPVMLQNKTVSTVSVGGRAGLANTTGASNTFVGRDAALVNTTGSNNVIAGWKAGGATNGSNSVFVGRSAAKATTTAGTNTVVGDSALTSNIAGTGNIIIGQASASNVTGNNNIVLGASSATALTTGQNSITIGASLASSNIDAQINIGNALGINTATSKVTFNNAYSFPLVAGTSGDILRLNNSNQLLWASRMPRDVAGALADVQPYFESLASQHVDSTTALGGVYFMKVMSFASASLSYIETYVNNSFNASAVNIQMGIYDASKNLLAYTNISVAANATAGEVYDKLLDPTTNAITTVSVTAGANYYLAVYCDNSGANPAEFLRVNDPYNQSIYQAGSPGTKVPNTVPAAPPTPTSNNSIWVHAF